MKIKKLNELFDDSDLRDQMEIPYIKGELDMDSGNWEDYSLKSDNKSIVTELRKITYKYPILRRFSLIEKKIEDVDSIFTFYATSKNSDYDNDTIYYAQISFGFKDEQYYTTAIFRLLEDLDPKKFTIREYNTKDISMIYKFIDNFLNACVKLNITEESDFDKYTTRFN
jgi:hypothetical protein